MARPALPEPGFIDTVLNLVGHSLVGCIEYRRLIHIVPEASQPVGNKAGVKGAPPLACALLRKIGEYGWPGPHLAHKKGAVEVSHKVSAGCTRVVGRVALARQTGDMQVGDPDNVE